MIEWPESNLHKCQLCADRVELPAWIGIPNTFSKLCQTALVIGLRSLGPRDTHFFFFVDTRIKKYIKEGNTKIT